MANLGHGHGPFQPQAFFIAVPQNSQGNGIGNTNGATIDLWKVASNTPRIDYLYSNDEIVAQVVNNVLDDDGVLLYSIRTAVRLPETYDTDELASHPVDYGESFDQTIPKSIRSIQVEQTQDEIVAQAVSGIVDEDYDLSTFLRVDSKVWMPVPWQYGAGEGSVWNPIDEDYYYDLITRRINPIQSMPFVDEVIVPQPILSIDEGVWDAVISRQSKPNLDIYQLQDELGFQTIAYDEGTWEPPFATKSPLWLHVNNTQDELVNQPVPLNVDEDYYYWLGIILVKAKQIYVISNHTEAGDMWVPDTTPPIPPIPPIPPPIIHGHGKYRIIPQMDVVDKSKFPQDNVGVSNC